MPWWFDSLQLLQKQIVIKISKNNRPVSVSMVAQNVISNADKHLIELSKDCGNHSYCKRWSVSNLYSGVQPYLPPLWTNCNDVDIVMWLLCRNKSVKMFNNLLQIKSKNTKYRNWSKCLQSTQMWQWFVWTCLSACWLASYLASWFAPLAKCSACFGHINHISISNDDCSFSLPHCVIYT